MKTVTLSPVTVLLCHNFARTICYYTFESVSSLLAQPAKRVQFIHLVTAGSLGTVRGLKILVSAVPWPHFHLFEFNRLQTLGSQLNSILAVSKTLT